MKDPKDHKPKSSTGKRKFHQKSRLGCLTCKRRRVKCDETKPICMKCLNLSLTCGYVTDPPVKDEFKRRKSSVSSDERSSVSYDVKKEDDSELSPELPNLTANPLSTNSSNSNESPLTGATSSVRSLDMAAACIEEKKSAIKSSLLNAGNLNNVNLSHLVHSLTELGGDLSSLGNLASLSNLATLAQLPIDISNLGALLDGAAFQGAAPSKKEEAKDGECTETEQKPSGKIPNISPNVNTQSSSSYQGSPMNNPMAAAMGSSSLNMLDLRLMFHYTSQVASTITGAGISDTNIWNYDIPMLAFDYPFLMHSILAFSATHLSRTEKGLDQCVTFHRGDALRLLREAVFDINADNTDALVASALILIMDSLANASFPLSTSPKSLPASAWIFHVKGAATILTAVWPLTETSRFYKFISVDLGDLGDIINQRVNLDKESLSDRNMYVTDLECHDADIADLFPVLIDSPYLITLAYLNKLHKERYKSDFILRIFAFPALLDKKFLSLLMSGDVKSMRIMRSYYKLLRSFTMEMKDKVWFLEGVSNVLPVDVEQYAGGAGGMHMMLDFLGGGPSIVHNELDEEIKRFDPTGSLSTKLADTNNLPSEITSDLEIMQAADTFMNMK